MKAFKVQKSLMLLTLLGCVTISLYIAHSMFSGVEVNMDALAPLNPDHPPQESAAFAALTGAPEQIRVMLGDNHLEYVIMWSRCGANRSHSLTLSDGYVRVGHAPHLLNSVCEPRKAHLHLCYVFWCKVDVHRQYVGPLYYSIRIDGRWGSPLFSFNTLASLDRTPARFGDGDDAEPDSAVAQPDTDMRILIFADLPVDAPGLDAFVQRIATDLVSNGSHASPDAHGRNQNATLPPHIAAFLGDFAYEIDLNGVRLFRKLQPMFARLPLLAVPGNHDVIDSYQHWSHYFNVPFSTWPEHQHSYFSLRLQFTSIIAIDSELLLEESRSDEELMWLDNALAKASRLRSLRPWIIVVMHVPLYCATLDDPQCPFGSTQTVLQPLLEPLLHLYGVDIVLQGHEHVYARTWPVYLKAPTVAGASSAPLRRSYVDPDFPVYITVASFGVSAFRSRTPPQAQWPAHIARVLSGPGSEAYGLLTVNHNFLQFQLLAAQTGRLLDSFNLTQRCRRFVDRNHKRTCLP